MKRLRDLEHLPLVERVVADALVDVDVDPEFVDERLCLLAHLFFLEHPEPLHLTPEVEVLVPPHGRDDVLLLVDERDAVVRRVTRVRELDGLPVDVQLPLVGLQHAGQDVQERALARAVLSDEADDFAVVDRQRHAVERLDVPERLRDALDAEAVLVTAGLAGPGVRRVGVYF